MAIVISTLDGLEIASEITGEGRPVLLLHGWGGRIESMQPVAAALAARGYCAHSLDLPGFGRSALPPEVWGVADYARLVAHYLDAAHLKPVNLIGHSFGGRIALAVSANYADGVNKLVLADSAGVLTPPTLAQRLRTGLFAAANGVLSLPGLKPFHGSFRRWARDHFGSEDLRNAGPLEPIFRKVITEDLLPHAARIKAPTLLIWGDQDTDTPLWQGKLLEKTIPDAGLVVFQGAGHFAYQQRLTDFVRIVDTFLKDKGQT
jgi:pimeloyl-ACP methyl ester carboxylesterase